MRSIRLAMAGLLLAANTLYVTPRDAFAAPTTAVHPSAALHGFGDAAALTGPIAGTLAGAVVGLAVTPTGQGAWLAGADGGVFAYGDAPFLGSGAGHHRGVRLAAIAATPTGRGYWLAWADGVVAAYGDAPAVADLTGVRLVAPIVGAASADRGRGLLLVAADGGVFALGTARFSGSLGGLRLNQPIVAIAPAPSGDGYWLVAADGGVFAFGTARFHGSLGSVRLNQPIVAMAATPSGDGYWLAGADGGVFAFGAAAFLGSAAGRGLSGPVVAMAGTPSGAGYWLATDARCAPVGTSTAEQAAGGAAPPGALTDVDVDVTACFTRVTFTFRGSAPATGDVLTYRVGYAAPPFVNTAGYPVGVRGPAYLAVNVSGSTVDMTSPTYVITYPGPDEITVPASPVHEVQMTDDFEAVMNWVIGLDAVRPYRAFVLDAPLRLVIDIDTAAPATPIAVAATKTYLVTSAAATIAVDREVPAPLTAYDALRELLWGPRWDEFRTSGLSTAIPDGTRLLGASVASGVATVNLSGEFASGGGTASMRLRLAQLVWSVTEVPGITGVKLRIDGAAIPVFSGEGIVLPAVLTRSWTGLSPGEPA